MESERRSTKRKRKVIHLGYGSKAMPSPSHILDNLEANPSLGKSIGEDITFPMKDTAKGGGKKGHHIHGQDQSKTQLDRLEKSMHDLTDNQETLCRKIETLVPQFSTKVMHSIATTLYFLQVNKEGKDAGKYSETTHSLYSFLVDDWLKTLLEKPSRRRWRNRPWRILMKRRGRTWRRRSGTIPTLVFIFIFIMLWLTVNSMPFVTLLVNVDINHFNNNTCNLCCQVTFWQSMYVRGSMVDTNILKYLVMVSTVC